ncbi:MAG: YggS family pyridoxal phosphate enzyme [Rhodocyclales bacterium RIFCSPLOWO2_02_FULL_63_24]|nr:MAG: YggS family pyridoxal phosphate enzyme [Rhodocyclales bacterium GWA2_65_19]OHC72701.1 MAG: YggS family pyridoxal phosphate enzyme [Rhodocyclales bacterium RIFCSPLOWO2_02_FULL_63_24]
MTSIAANLQAVRARIAAACVAAGRRVESVQLLAVSKTWPAASVREAVAAGQCAFGENYVQEGVDKVAELANKGSGPRLEWHFIGPLQSNKTRPVAENFSWVHSVDRLKIAERLAAQRPPGLAPLQVCIQVNVSAEASKSGCSPEQLAVLAPAVAALPGLKLRGLMAIPEASDDMARQREQFAMLRRLRDSLALDLDTLSMGMSHDLEAAIMEGSTLLRIGTAIFGERVYA